MHIGLGLLYTPYLRELYLSYNQLSSLDGLINLQELTILDLSYNYINDLKEVVKLKSNFKLSNLSILCNPVSNKKQIQIQIFRQELFENEIRQLLPQVQYLDSIDLREPQKKRLSMTNVNEKSFLESHINKMKTSIQTHTPVFDQSQREHQQQRNIQQPQKKESLNLSIPNIEHLKQQQSFDNSLNTSQSQISNIRQSKETLNLFYNQLQTQKAFETAERVPIRGKMSEVEVLQSQVKSLKEIIHVLENHQMEQQKENHPFSLNPGQEYSKIEALTKKWREKVYECLVDKKRYEFIIKENNKAYKEETNQLQKQNKSLISDSQISINRINQLQHENEQFSNKIYDLEKINTQIKQRNEQYKEELTKVKKIIEQLSQNLSSQQKKYFDIFETQTHRLSELSTKLFQLKQNLELNKVSSLTKDNLNRVIKQNQQQKQLIEEQEKQINELESKIQGFKLLEKQVQENQSVLEYEKEKVTELETSIKLKDESLNKLKNEDKLKNQYISTLEEEQRSNQKRIKDLEEQLRQIKSECATTLVSKEKVLLNQVKQNEQELEKTKRENQDLEQRIQQLKQEHFDSIEKIKFQQQNALKEKDKLIRQVKGERDSLFDELKHQQSFSKNKNKGLDNSKLSTQRAQVQASTIQQQKSIKTKMERSDWVQSPISQKESDFNWRQDSGKETDRKIESQIAGTKISQMNPMIGSSLKKGFQKIQEFERQEEEDEMQNLDLLEQEALQALEFLKDQ